MTRFYSLMHRFKGLDADAVYDLFKRRLDWCDNSFDIFTVIGRDGASFLVLDPPTDFETTEAIENAVRAAEGMEAEVKHDA